MVGWAVVVVTFDVLVVVVVTPVLAAVVVVVGAVGVTKGMVSPASVAVEVVGAANKLVQDRAATQLCWAVASGVPVSGSGSPSTTVAGRKAAEVMCRPSAVRTRAPLSVSGAVLS